MEAYDESVTTWLTAVLKGSPAPIMLAIDTPDSSSCAQRFAECANAFDVKIFSFEFQANRIADPYAVFGHIIGWYAETYGEKFVEDLIKKHCYSLHTEIFLAWRRGHYHYRQEPLLPEEVSYEEYEFFNAMDEIMRALAKQKAFILLANNINQAPVSVTNGFCQLLQSQAANRGWGIVAFFNTQSSDQEENTINWTALLKYFESFSLITQSTNPEPKSPQWQWQCAALLNSADDRTRVFVAAADMFAFADVIRMVQQVMVEYDDDLINGKMLFISAFCSLMSGDLNSAERDLVQSQNRLQLSPENDIHIANYYWLCLCYTLKSRSKLARAAQEQCEKLALQYKNFKFFVLSHFANFYLNSGIAYHRITEPFIKALRYFLGCAGFKNLSLMLDTQIYSKTGRLDMLMPQHYMQNCLTALRGTRKVGNLIALSNVLHTMSLVRFATENPRQASRLIEMSLDLREERHYRTSPVTVLNTKGYFCTVQEQWSDALSAYEKALSSIIQFKNLKELPSTLYNVAWLYTLSGNFQLALTVLNNLIQLMQVSAIESMPFRNIKDVYTLKAWLLMRLNQPIQAQYCLSQVTEFSALNTNPFTLVMQPVLSATAAFNADQMDAAIGYLETAKSSLAKVTDIDNYLRGYLGMEIVRVYAQLNRLADVRILISELKQIARRLRLDLMAQKIARFSLGMTEMAPTKLDVISYPYHILIDFAQQEAKAHALQQQLSDLQQTNLLVEMSTEEPNVESFLHSVIEALDRRVPAEDFAIFLQTKGQPIKPIHVVKTKNANFAKLRRCEERLIGSSPQQCSFLEGGTFYSAWPLRVTATETGWLLIGGNKHQAQVWNETFFKQMAQQLDLILDRKLREASLEQLSKTDLLTGILNRAGFQEQLSRQMKAQLRNPDVGFALCFFDLDHFKYFNDHFGHETGDLLLKNLAKLIYRQLRPHDEFARIGGDEFIILLRAIKVRDAISQVERLRSSIAAPDWWLMLVKNNDESANPVPKEEWITASFGVLIVEGPLAEDAKLAELITQADLAMYEAKYSGKNCVVSKDYQPVTQA